MIDRKKKLRLKQFFLLFFGVLLIYFTYYNKNSENNQSSSYSELTNNKIVQKSDRSTSEKGDIFFNIEYTGMDLNGNRYVLKSKEAYLDELNSEIVYMQDVNAVFYFKNETNLYIRSDDGIYNNRTLDMKFEKNVKAKYLESELFAEKANYSNTDNYLEIYENVRIDDIRGNLIADKLLFDITKQKLDITSFNKDKINVNVKLDEKRF